MIKPLVHAILLTGFCASAHAANQPNVLLIMSNDLLDFGRARTRGVVKTLNFPTARVPAAPRSSGPMFNTRSATRAATR